MLRRGIYFRFSELERMRDGLGRPPEFTLDRLLKTANLMGDYCSKGRTGVYCTSVLGCFFWRLETWTDSKTETSLIVSLCILSCWSISSITIVMSRFIPYACGCFFVLSIMVKEDLRRFNILFELY